MAEKSKGSKPAAGETPMMRQYSQMKALYPDAVMLFRMGDFYESFNEDAVRVSSILGITLTKRSNGGAADMDLAGFPYHALDTYLPKLVRAGQRVAICDQLEDPKLAKGLVKRGVTEVITPGVVLNEGVLERKENNFLASLCDHEGQYGLALIDVSTGEFYLAQGTAVYIERLLANFSPKELLVSRSYWSTAQERYGEKFYVSRIDDWAFSYVDAGIRLRQHFGTTSLRGYGFEGLYQGISAAGAILAYLDLTMHANISHVIAISRIEEDNFVWLDRSTIRNLEIFAPSGEGGLSLVDVVDRTSTPMGGRMLRRWLSLPLKDVTQIRARNQAVSYLVEDMELRGSLAELLAQIGDLERLASRIAAGRILPRELLRLAETLRILQQVKHACEQVEQQTIRIVCEQINPCATLLDTILSDLHADPSPLGKGEIFARGVNQELDELRDLRTSSREYLDALRDREAAHSGIQNLKIGFNNVFGYYFEVRNTQKEQVPSSWIRKQTLVSAERYVSGELKEFEEKILTAEDKILEIETALYKKLLQDLLDYVVPIQTNASLVAQLDVLVSHAILAVDKSWACPAIDDSYVLKIEDGWHPVIAERLPPEEEYVPNSISLDPDDLQIMMITGPNMSGKSALLRQTALIVLLAQIGSFVPAHAAQIGLIDKIFTRVGASDNISAGESTFMVEMIEAASILNNISPRSLILLDEIGRGTSTYDGISIAWAMAEYIHDSQRGRAKTLFATHYHELNEMENSFPRIRNFNVSVREVDDKVVFLRRLQLGGIEHSFGIHVARLAGMPLRVVQRANEILALLEAKRNVPSEGNDSLWSGQPVHVFEAEDPILKSLRIRISEIDVNHMTPVEALNELVEIRRIIGLE